MVTHHDLQAASSRAPRPGEQGNSSATDRTLSLLTKSMSNLSVSTAGNPGQAWIIRESPLTVAGNSKGQGVFATRDIAAGEAIMIEEPLLLIEIPPELDMKGEDGPASESGPRGSEQNCPQSDIDTSEDEHTSRLPPAMIWEQYSQLSGVWRRQFDSLTYAADQELMKYCGLLVKRTLLIDIDIIAAGRVVAIWRNNNFDTEMDCKVVLRNASRINHSCLPNAACNWHDSSKLGAIRATRDIRAGQEILISYVTEYLPKAERQAELNHYGFECTCEACSGQEGSSYAAETEVRRLKISSYREKFLGCIRNTEEPDLEQELVYCHKILKHLAHEPAMTGLKAEM